MATADQYETAILAIQTALQTLAGYGNTGGGASGSPASLVTATSTKQHLAEVFSGADTRRLIERAVLVGDYGIRVGVTPGPFKGNSALLIGDNAFSNYIFARIDK
jgi:hypothetical protein